MRPTEILAIFVAGDHQAGRFMVKYSPRALSPCNLQKYDPVVFEISHFEVGRLRKNVRSLWGIVFFNAVALVALSQPGTRQAGSLPGWQPGRTGCRIGCRNEVTSWQPARLAINIVQPVRLVLCIVQPVRQVARLSKYV